MNNYLIFNIQGTNVLYVKNFGGWEKLTNAPYFNFMHKFMGNHSNLAKVSS